MISNKMALMAGTKSKSPTNSIQAPPTPSSSGQPSGLQRIRKLKIFSLGRKRSRAQSLPEPLINPSFLGSLSLTKSFDEDDESSGEPPVTPTTPSNKDKVQPSFFKGGFMNNYVKRPASVKYRSVSDSAACPSVHTSKSGPQLNRMYGSYAASFGLCQFRVS
jgi:hypothetical protein